MDDDGGWVDVGVGGGAAEAEGWMDRCVEGWRDEGREGGMEGGAQQSRSV